MREWLRLLRYSRPYWLPLLVSVVLMAAVGGAQAMLALLIGPVFDQVLNPAPAASGEPLFTIPGFGHPVYLRDLTPGFLEDVWAMVAFGILAVFVIKGFCDYFGNYLINYVGISAITDMRQSVFDKVLEHSAEFFEATATGRLMSSIMNDIEKIQLAVSHMLADLLRRSFTVAALLFVLIDKDWKLALISLTLLPTVLVPTARIGRWLRKTTRRAQDQTAELNQILQEALSGHLVVKSFSAEAYESRRFREAGEKLRRSNLRFVAQQALTSPVIEILAALTIVGLLTYATRQIQAGALTAGQFSSFVIALLMLYEPVKRLTGIHNIFQQALGAAQKVFEYLDMTPQIASPPGARPLTGFRDSIVYDDVYFRYPRSPDRYALKGVSLEVKAGELVALVGPSGAGKTTLASLLARFYDPAGGAVRIDGADLRELELKSLRGMVSVVAQDTFLFDDTVANNIRYGRQDTGLDKVREAARNALAEEFILELPEGYETRIGERGLRLSGGQRQRLAIARALLKDAPILILDEATSHLDTESEVLVQKALANLMAGRTVIVIAHRLSTVRKADKIVVLDQGRILEVGTHQELVSGGGIYKRLHDLQFLEDASLVDL